MPIAVITTHSFFPSYYTHYFIYQNWIGTKIVHAKVDGEKVYFQIAWTSGSLPCQYGKNGEMRSFSREATYNRTYAQCSPWTKDNPSYTITLTLNGVTYTTDENTAISNGPITGSYSGQNKK